MRRLAFKLVVFPLLGTIVNVVVAWGCAVWSPLTASGTAVAPVDWAQEAAWIVVEESRGVGLLKLELRGYFMRPPASVKMRSLPRWSRLGDQFVVMKDDSERRVVTRYEETAAGWPCVALTGFRNSNPYVARGMEFIKAGWMEPWYRRILPFWPVWPGFAINVVFYGAILWLLCAGFAALRRRRRIKRGLCPGCAYPVGDSEVCTECGNGLTRRRS